MNRAKILERIIKELLEDLLEIHSWTFPITEETHLIQDLSLDSLQLVELAVELEQIFGFDVSDEEAMGWNSVGNVVDTVERFFAGA